MTDRDEAITATPNSNLRTAYSLSTFAELLGLSGQQLGYFLYKRDITANYTRFEIKKRNGATREIKAPNEKLKFLQRNVARELATLREFKPIVTGFVQRRSLLDNALFHVGKRFVLNIDLVDFFGAINFGRIYGMLSKPPYSIERSIAAAIAKIATHENTLPQGAPTSPILANLICAKLDAELDRLCKANKCAYSRYADDITISSQSKKFPLAHLDAEGSGPSIVVISPELRNIVESNGFKINEAKSRLYVKEWRQEVTGLIVNEKPNVKRTYVRAIRATLHAIEKYGIAAAQSQFENKYGGKVDLACRVAGQIGFVGQIRGRQDGIYRRLVNRFNALNLTVKLRTLPTRKENAEAAVWVLEGQDSAGRNPTQGTAFFVDGYGLVTCAHCVNDNMHIYHSRKHSVKFPVTAVKVDADRDLAILSTPAELQNIVPLRVGDPDSIPDQAEIWLLGYPNHSSWKPIRSEPGIVVRRFPTMGLKYFEISPKVISGNSGGPITDDKFNVIAVATKGVTHSVPITDAEFIGVFIDELAAVVAKPL